MIINPYNIDEDEEDGKKQHEESDGLFSRESGDIIPNNNVTRNNEMIEQEEEELKIDSNSQRSKNKTGPGSLSITHKSSLFNTGAGNTKSGTAPAVSKKDDPEHIQRLINERMREIQTKINKPHYNKP